MEVCVYVHITFFIYSFLFHICKHIFSLLAPLVNDCEGCVHWKWFLNYLTTLNRLKILHSVGEYGLEMTQKGTVVTYLKELP
jgi:hypothetical protein